jgi:hypothetical protein
MFLDVIYYCMLQRLDYDDESKTPEAVRRTFDQQLNVMTWKTPSGAEPVYDEDRPKGAPDWWISDEEASQSFLRDRGVPL